jgi:hypothetical protein
MTITTHNDLRKAARKARDLSVDLPYLTLDFIHGNCTEDDVETCWRDLCRTLDRVVYAAGGHRDHLTWHLFGATLTAETLWSQEDADTMDDTNLDGFLFSGEGRSAHGQLALKAFWHNRVQPLPPLPSHGYPSLPAQEGRATEAQMDAHEAARQQAIVRFQALSAAKGGV